jgi:hypothetical protein
MVAGSCPVTPLLRHPILSYDENDGFFDQVIPPAAPPGTPDEFVTLTSNNLSQYEISQLPLPAIPTANRRMPRQEPGNRPHIP